MTFSHKDHQDDNKIYCEFRTRNTIHTLQQFTLSTS